MIFIHWKSPNQRLQWNRVFNFVSECLLLERILEYPSTRNITISRNSCYAEYFELRQVEGIFLRAGYSDKRVNEGQVHTVFKAPNVRAKKSLKWQTSHKLYVTTAKKR